MGGVTSADAVQGFLEALAVGDATAALAYAASPPADPAMLTDQVLAGSLATNPLGGIQVVERTRSSTHATVQALYRLRDRKWEATFDVMRIDDGWLLPTVSTRADLGRIKARALGLLLNGVALSTDTPELFIGTYTLTPSDSRLELTGSTFFVESYRTNPDTSGISVDLSDEGLAAVREAAVSKLAGCLAAKELAPAGCGFHAPTPIGTPREQSITWTATGGARWLRSLRVSLSRDDPTTARATVRIPLVATYELTAGLPRRATSAISGIAVTLSSLTIGIEFVGPG